jgi:hypothetical protein
MSSDNEESFTKLVSSITESSVWDEDHATRIVWITMLAKVNKNGYVGASIPGLARLARVTIAECEAALAKFKAPDPYSRTPDHEGRRIADAPRGWVLLNHPSFRNKRSPEEKREYDRNRLAEKRAARRSAPQDAFAMSFVSSENGRHERLSPEVVRVVHTDTDTDTDTDQREELNTHAGSSWAESEDSTGLTASPSLRPVRAADASARPANDQDVAERLPGEPEPARPTHELVRLCFSARFVKARGNPPVWGQKQVAHMHVIASWVESLNGDDEKLLARLLDGFFRDPWAIRECFPIGALANNPERYFTPSGPPTEPPRGSGRRSTSVPGTSEHDFEHEPSVEEQLSKYRGGK